MVILTIANNMLINLQDHGNTILPLKEDNLCVTVKLYQN